MLAKSFNVIDGADSFYYKRNNSIGILLIHGFVGTPQSVKYIGKQYANKGYTVLAPRLKGHGTHYKDLNHPTYEDWIEDCDNAYKFLKESCKDVIIVGQSMGGTLALYLANKYKNVSGVVTINAAFDVPGYEYYKSAEAPRYIQEGKPDIKDPTADEITYEQVPLHSIKQLLSLIKVTKDTLRTIECPLLLFKSAIDHVVPPTSTEFIYHTTKAKHKFQQVLENSHHVASMDYDKDKIVSDSIAFIRGLTNI